MALKKQLEDQERQNSIIQQEQDKNKKRNAAKFKIQRSQSFTMWLQQNEMQNYIHDDSYIELHSVDDNPAVEVLDEQEEMQMVKSENKKIFNSFLFGKNNQDD